MSWLVGFCLFLFGFGFKCNKSLVSPSPVRWACTDEKLHFVREYPSALGGVTAKSCRGGRRGRLGARNIEMLLLSFGAFTLSCGSRRGPTHAVGTAMKCTQEGHLPNALQACWARRAKILQPPHSQQQLWVSAEILGTGTVLWAGKKLPHRMDGKCWFGRNWSVLWGICGFFYPFFVMESRQLSQVSLPGVISCVRLSWDLGTQGAQALLSLLKHQGWVLTGQKEGKNQWFFSLNETLMRAVKVACLCV